MNILPVLPDIRYVQIQTQSRCNADCVFCPYIESYHHAHPGIMDPEVWRLILKNLLIFERGINVGKVCPYLMQEPLIDRTIFSKIGDIYRCFPGTYVEVSTNGAALTDTAIDKLLNAVEGKRHDIWVMNRMLQIYTAILWTIQLMQPTRMDYRDVSAAIHVSHGVITRGRMVVIGMGRQSRIGEAGRKTT